jgi:hypothetical protein
VAAKIPERREVICGSTAAQQSVMPP